MIPFAVNPERSFFVVLCSHYRFRCAGKIFSFGCMLGIGNVNYGIAIRHVGMSLGIGVSIGITLMVGTLMSPLLHKR